MEPDEKRKIKPKNYPFELAAQGKFWFTSAMAQRDLHLNPTATRAAMKRLQQHNLVVSPARGFYLVVPPEYQAYGCLPAKLFIHELMKFLEAPYYVGLLSAAEFYGASHQKPQVFQVVALQSRRDIQVGRISIEFIKRKDLSRWPKKAFSTDTGTILVSTPEATLVDLLCFAHHAIGIDNIATIIMELKDQIDPMRLREMTRLLPQAAWMQRLGFLFDFLGMEALSNIMLESLSDRTVNWVRLTPSEGTKGYPHNQKWKIIMNTQVEPDL